MTRVAVKEAARAWIQARSGELLYPADLILQARKEGGWQVICDPAIYAGPLPDVAVCQRQGDFIAAAVPGGRPLGIDLALVGSEGHDAAVTAAARAAVRSRGQFPDAGTSIEIAEIGADGQHVVVRAAGESVSVLIGERQDHIVALA
jgi:hypothetical protein